MNYPLSPLQQAMLMGSISPKVRDLYLVQSVFDWQEQIRIPEFEQAWNELTARHEALRSTFFWRDSPKPYQQVQSSFIVQCEINDFASFQVEEKATALQMFFDSDRARGLSLSAAPPWRISILRFADGSNKAVWTFHHLLLDGRSHILLLRELIAIYDGLLSTELNSGSAEIPQRTHVEWLLSQNFSKFRDYWTKYLNLEKLCTTLPSLSENSRDAIGHNSYDLRLGAELAGRMKAFSKSEGISAGNLLQAAWALVLGWLAGESDVVFGAVRACRKSGLPDGDKIIGLVINTLPLRVCWDENSSLRSIVQAIARDWHQFRNYEHTPLQQICKWMELPVNRELFTSAVSFSSDYIPHAIHGDSPLRASRDFWVRQTVPYCSVDGGFDRDDFHLTVSTPNSLIEASLAHRLPHYLRNALEAIVQRPDSPAWELCLLDEDERNRVAKIFNTRWEASPTAIDWIAAVDLQAKRQGDRSAVYDPAGCLSWRDLEARSNQVAQTLRARGVQQNDLIAVFLTRSASFVWVCLGIMKAGAAYLPVDTLWPSQRIANVLKGALVKKLVSAVSLIERVPLQFRSDPVLEEEIFSHSCDPVQQSLTPEQLAYVIYTSGSTGLPKGVEVTQRGLQNLITDMTSAFALSPGDRASFLSNTAFDASVHEVWPALSAGASIHIPEMRACADPKGMLDWLTESAITFTFLSTVMAESVLQLCGGNSKLSLRFLLTGGDQLRRLPEWEGSFQLVNEYGPTEYTVVATRHNVDPDVDRQRNIPIGKPVRGTRAYVVNPSLQLVPEGICGELLLAGHGLSHGYRGQAEMTSSKFIDCPIREEPSRRIYRTGDLVRWSADGELQFFGRIDSQVKLRGFRIELGEIEACLLQHPAVAEAVVVLNTSKTSAKLMAVIVPKPDWDRAQLDQTLSNHLRKLVPEYMLPSGYLWQERILLNHSGKYDRKALASLVSATQTLPETAPEETLSEAENKMLRTWEKVLGVPRVKPEDRFLDLGATSLSMIHLICAIELDFGKTVSAADLMNDPRPGDLLRLLEDSTRQNSPIVVPLKRGGSKLPLFIIPGAGGGVHWFRELAGWIAADRPVFGLELLSLSAAVQQNFTVPRAAEELTEVLLTMPEGEPYALSGYSGGGLVALEVAARLQQLGRKVGAVILIETYPPDNLADGPAKLLRWARGWLALPHAKRWTTLVDRVNWYRRAKLASQEAADPISEELIAVKQRHIQAFVSSSFPSYRGKVVIAAADDRPLSVALNPWEEWEANLATKFEVIRVPGDHYTLLRGENARLLADSLDRVADEVSVSSGEGMVVER